MVGGLVTRAAAAAALARVRWVGIALALVLSLIAMLPTGALAAAAPRIGLGVYRSGAGEDPGLIDEFSNEVEEAPAIVSFYRKWDVPLIDTSQLAVARSRGAVPMVSWEPWEENGNPIPLRSIASGQEDAYLTESARAAAAWGGPILVRFAHEMNGDWYPWGLNWATNPPSVFKRAWRHVVEVFRQAGATNVQWVWCPYVANTHMGQFRRLYPGGKWVDWTGLDGFNWGGSTKWRSFNAIFWKSYRSIVRFAKRPMVLAELGVNQVGGNKAHWVLRALRRALPRYHDVRAMVWFDEAERGFDFRVDSSARALAAFRLGLRGSLFGADSQQVLSVPKRLARRSPGKRHARSVG